MKILKKFVKWVLIAMLVAVVLGGGFILFAHVRHGHWIDGAAYQAALWAVEVLDMPVPNLDQSNLDEWQPTEGSRFYGDDTVVFHELPIPQLVGTSTVIEGHPLIGEYGIMRTHVPYADINPLVVNALIVAEDEYYWTHPGIDWHGLLRAGVNAVKASIEAGRLKHRGGGSTITQQLVKLLVLKSSKQDADRKVPEMILAWRLNQVLSKERVLEIYFNNNEYGNRAFGLDAGAEVYFGKSQKDITAGEAAMLAGLQKSPTRYNPCRHPKRAEDRRRYVLGRMWEENATYHFFADEAAYKQAQEVPTYRCQTMRIDSMGYAPWYARQEVERFMSPEAIDQKLLVFTSIHPEMQAAAERALWKRLDELNAKYAKKANGDEFGPKEKVQGAVVILDWRTRMIRAIVGGRENVSGGLNRAQSHRQPGSVVKPFVYAALFESAGYAPADRCLDQPSAFPVTGQKDYEPKNHDGKHGWIPPGYETVTPTTTIANATARSVNVCAVAAAATSSVGMRRVLTMLEKVGIKSPLPPIWPTAIGGSGGVRLLELTNAYATIASGGFYAPPRVIEAVYNRQGKIELRAHLDLVRVITSSVAYMTYSTMHAVVHDPSGSGRLLAKYDREGCPVVGKTGTTNVRVVEQGVEKSVELDGYFCSIWGPLAMCVRVGRDEHLPIAKGEGSKNAVLVTADIIEQLKAMISPCEPVAVPDSIVLYPVDALGTLTSTDAPDATLMPFPRGYVFTGRPPPLMGKPIVAQVKPDPVQPEPDPATLVDELVQGVETEQE